ncbi:MULTISPECIES: hypothetical protein [unclassified Pseudomonas]|uniref:hypothetical protein n=1 Tax=unclassified Pseudomonas TaxID=196821 RepID=UPI0008D7B804|nr:MULTISPECIES: hypothetical protein [unclassified Pseudomonas]PMV27351.1 hypothetical protein C1X17_00785 [Pseudomonas sp. FW305-3-2-15-C-TSA2]PMV32606.1 hypothetical protein C1X22_00785 [Pseudomonas sp. DP16D-L5]PMV42320.1 hypothetical protein C1X21_00785 [Pseudomonas sp. FW305-3-2-15-A-LB2]PMV49641.1 hypothetical protein C1X16_01615 [Pseudomonas sp. FW305-3-2-15-C-R2A1]PMV55244.1 hypothetical protein C1X18_00785 [Pseudomonas sp. FW305-3-2-15-C-LB1]
MTTLKRAGIFIVLMATSMASVQAIADTFTATLDKTGKITAQSPKWIKDVKLTAQPDYFSDYKVRFVPGVFKDAPRFCTVSVTDVSSNDHIFYGHAKLGSVPAINYVNVLTLKVGDNKPAGDSSMGFQLMCVK